jgi:hypothetical protein
MLHAGLDLSRARLDVCLVDESGELVEHTAAPPDADGLRHLADRPPFWPPQGRGRPLPFCGRSTGCLACPLCP